MLDIFLLSAIIIVYFFSSESEYKMRVRPSAFSPSGIVDSGTYVPPDVKQIHTFLSLSFIPALSFRFVPCHSDNTKHRSPSITLMLVFSYKFYLIVDSKL